MAVLGIGASIAGCAQPPEPTPSPSPPVEATLATQVQAAVRMREDLDLEASPAFVTAIQADPAAPIRYGIRVTADEATLLDQRDLPEAIDMREDFGLVTDRTWVLAVLADPTAVRWGPGILLTRAEVAAIDERSRSTSSIRKAAGWYGAVHADEYAGLWFQDGGPAVMQFTGHLPEHRAVLAALIPPEAGPFEVREVEWTLARLDEHYERVRNESRWFRDQGMLLEDTSTSIPANAVVIQVKLRRPDPAAEDLIREHLGAGSWLRLDVRVDRAGQLPWSRGLVVQVVRADGTTYPGLVCELRTALPDAVGENVFRTSDEQGRCTWDNGEVRATDYAVLIREQEEEGGRILGQTAVTLTPDSRVNATVITR